MQNLEHALKLGMTCPIYLFHGEEALLMEQMVDKIANLVAPDGESWNREVYHGDDITPAEVVMSAQSGGFMGVRRLIIIRNVDWLKPARKIKDAETEEENACPSLRVDLEPLIAYAADPNPDAVLILLCNGNVPSNSRLLKAVNGGGRAVSFPALKGKEKEKWLADYFRAAAKISERGVVSFIALMSGDGLLNAKSEADKLILYTAGKNKVSIEDARNTVSQTALSGVFDLSDRMAEKKGAAAVAILRQLWLQGETPQKLLAMLGTQYRNSLAVKNMLARGFTTKEIVGRLSMNPYAAQKCAVLARFYTERQLSRALELLLSADIAQKKGEGEMKELLEVAILRICAM
jgi:DNA polymerase-3 subunit delta